MKIVHICLAGAMTDGLAYQENLLSKYQKELGMDVTVITSKWVYDANGRITRTDRADYVNADGVHVLRLDNRKNETYASKCKHFRGLPAALEQEKPDILFLHGVQFMEVPQVVRYVRAHPVTVYADNHADFANSARTLLSRRVLHGILWKHMACLLCPYTRKFYGVLPARVDFLKTVYGLPADKCELLLMGADDALVEKARSPESIRAVREKFNVAPDDFLVVTGGKINSNRPETLALMRAAANTQNPRIRLLVFGSPDAALQAEFDSLCDGRKVMAAGWVDAATTHDYMAAAQLVVFPGLHSVMWEQAVALGVPCAFKKMPGFAHVDIGGNCIFLEDTSQQALAACIETLADDPARCARMRNAAMGKGREAFSYRSIAKKSIG